MKLIDCAVVWKVGETKSDDRKINASFGTISSNGTRLPMTGKESPETIAVTTRRNRSKNHSTRSVRDFRTRSFLPLPRHYLGALRQLLNARVYTCHGWTFEITKAVSGLGAFGCYGATSCAAEFLRKYGFHVRLKVLVDDGKFLCKVWYTVGQIFVRGNGEKWEVGWFFYLTIFWRLWKWKSNCSKWWIYTDNEW